MSLKPPALKKTVTLRLPAELVDEFRTLVRDFSGKPHYLTVGAVVESAIRKHLTYLKQQIDSGSADATPASKNGVS